MEFSYLRKWNEVFYETENSGACSWSQVARRLANCGLFGILI